MKTPFEEMFDRDTQELIADLERYNKDCMYNYVMYGVWLPTSAIGDILRRYLGMEHHCSNIKF